MPGQWERVMLVLPERSPAGPERTHKSGRPAPMRGSIARNWGTLRSRGSRRARPPSRSSRHAAVSLARSKPPAVRTPTARGRPRNRPPGLILPRAGWHAACATEGHEKRRHVRGGEPEVRDRGIADGEPGAADQGRGGDPSSPGLRLLGFSYHRRRAHRAGGAASPPPLIRGEGAVGPRGADPRLPAKPQLRLLDSPGPWNIGPLKKPP
jgi:hypothetical protein